MIAAPGTRIGVIHSTGEWIPAVVTGEHWTGATIVLTLPDPLFVKRAEANGHAVQGCPLVLPTADESSTYWQHANACVFRRKCEHCKGFGSTLFEVASVVTVLTGERAVQEVTCPHCDGKGWQIYDPWEEREPDAISAEFAAAAPAEAHGDLSVPA
jgi:hypothetical protein